MEKNYRNDWRFSMHQFGQHNLAVFSSGFGDGRYATYIGFDTAGKPCRLLTDFGFFHWKDRQLRSCKVFASQAKDRRYEELSFANWHMLFQ